MWTWITTELFYLGRIMLAGICGGIIGYERQSRRKIAGLRTHVIVAVSAALMMILSKYGFQDTLSEYVKLDPSRVASGVVTAIGFLGSGMIFFRNNSISGLTTSAGIWATVGVGMAAGAGMYGVGISCTVIVLLVELFLGRKGILSEKGKESREITAKYRWNPEQNQKTLDYLRKQAECSGGNVTGLVVKRKEDGMMKVLLRIETGRDWDAVRFAEAMSDEPEIIEVTV